MTTLQNSIDQFATDAGIAHQIVHGDSTTTVETENGPVRSMAKLASDIEADVEAEIEAQVEVQIAQYAAQHTASLSINGGDASTLPLLYQLFFIDGGQP